MSEDYYSLLGVSKGAGSDEIKKAYRSKAMKFHPDKNSSKDAEEKFKKIKEAYEVLSDANKRSQYDRFGSQWNQPGFQGGFQGGTARAADFADIFRNFNSEMFGGFKGFGNFGNPFQSEQRQTKGQDVVIGLALTLEQIVLGADVQVNIPQYETCPSCSGSGCQPGHSISSCSSCQGSGVQTSRRGPMTVQQTCGSCMGTGKRNTHPCPSCSGKGKKINYKPMQIKIKPGHIDSHIILEGKGEPAPVANGIPGNLVIQCSLKEHAIFKMEGLNLVCQLPIHVATAILGGKVTVPTFYGHIALDILPGTTTDKVYRIQGKGIHSSQGIGDLYCKIKVEYPTHLTKEQEALVQALYQIKDEQCAGLKKWKEEVAKFGTYSPH